MLSDSRFIYPYVLFEFSYIRCISSCLSLFFPSHRQLSAFPLPFAFLRELQYLYPIVTMCYFIDIQWKVKTSQSNYFAFTLLVWSFDLLHTLSIFLCPAVVFQLRLSPVPGEWTHSFKFFVHTSFRWRRITIDSLNR